MSDIEKIKVEIERLYDGEVPKHDQQCDFSDGYFEGLATILNVIDSISEEKPSKDLEEAVENYIAPIENDEGLKYIIFNGRDIKNAFIAGSEWQKQRDAELIEIAYKDGITIGKTKQKEQMMKDAVEGEVIYDLGGFFRIKSEAIDGAKYKVGSWVKLIIVKED